MPNASQNPLSFVLNGIGVSSGIVLARSWNKQKEAKETPKLPNRKISLQEIDSEISRLTKAIETSRKQLDDLQIDVRETLGKEHAQILDFHLMMLDDVDVLDSIQNIMKTDLICVEQATQKAITQACQVMLAQDDEYLKARAEDIDDVGRRIIKNLMGINDSPMPLYMNEPVVLLAEDISPTEACKLDPKHIAAFIISKGSRTSHVAILARALGIPAIVAVHEPISDIPNGTLMALDVSAGKAFVNPDDATIEHYEKIAERQQFLMAQLESESQQPTETLDGYQACLVANVELPSEALNVKRNFNVGIGLFRTEFLFIDNGRFLSEEEQFEAYKDTAEAAYPFSVIFRTLDLGGDKFITQSQMPQELNPFMGTRAIRYSLQKPDIFKTQLRAILRASAFGKVRVMFPMISAVEELLEALNLLNEVKEDLLREGIMFNENLDVGCMIEVPSAALMAERLIKHVDFFSIGTNDLVQYSLAVDRANADIAYLYQPAHPAVIRQIKHVAETTFSNGKWVSVCGEMAADPLYTPLLLGMGIHELSMSPMSLARVHKLIRCIKMHEAESLVEEALKCNNGDEVNKLCRDFINKACPSLLPN